MAACCDGCGAPPGQTGDSRYRRILQFALVINAGMFLIEVFSGFFARSAALQADALDFLGDAANFGISLSVLGLASQLRAKAALIKGLTMASFGSWVLGNTAWQLWHGILPKAEIMGGVGLLALIANGAVAFLLYRYRQGDANMRSVWLCARNDALGNIAVVLAAGAVEFFAHHWPDIAVAGVIGSLNLIAAFQVIGRARQELRPT